MREKAEKMLIELYNFTIRGNKSSAQIDRENVQQWAEDNRTIDFLVEKRLIEKKAATGFVIIKLTAHGIEFVEDELL
ncbi:hypothetical protein D0439_10230 [Lysinibacillus fusiformis]|uniref:hypothetical protein n=1 Tax=Lysinibacillus fusiformis TaxID=28031 RepID=UPI0011BB4C79|nr:hypothetical protein [Lysinibacillus fusiformis]QDZ98986.1 hypothetical protein D0439_10230 [Lysinibacillus fusiformis]